MGQMRAQEDGGRERLLTVEWSGDGRQALLRMDGVAQALLDFERRESYCRSNFPNFMDGGAGTWRTDSHAWDDAALSRFEEALVAGSPKSEDQ